jgi:alanine racemase
MIPPSRGNSTDGAGSCLTAEISISAVQANLARLRALLPRTTRLCAVVKADCYGHGLKGLLETIAAQADWLGVTTPAEALYLRSLGYRGPALMFFPACSCAANCELRDTLCELVARQVTLTVTSAGEVPAIVDAARAVGAEAQVHVKIDTGMSRSGVPADRAAALVGQLRRNDRVRLTGLYTHFATADEADKGFAREQLRGFLAAVDACGGRDGLCLHAANSAATIDLPETHLDMVRPGIAIYGYQPSDGMQTRLPLRPAMRLTGTLMQVKEVRAGDHCGYGLTYAFQRAGRVGLVPIGYADGYLRCLSNAAKVSIRGACAPVRGRISMDQIIVDLADVPEARVGDVVEIVCPDPSAHHSVENLARLAGTIPYEITCRLGNRIRRVLAS